MGSGASRISRKLYFGPVIDWDVMLFDKIIMKKYTLIIMLISVLFFLGAISTFSFDINGGKIDNAIAEQIRNRIESSAILETIIIGDELVYASMALPVFYERRGYYPGWIDSGMILQQADSLIGIIKLAGAEGLRPNDYHVAKIDSLVSTVRRSFRLSEAKKVIILADLDLLLTDAFLIYGSHLISGKVNPVTIDPEWFTNLCEADLISILDNALTENSISSTLRNLAPPQAGYTLLKKALRRYRALDSQGGWPAVPEGPTLKKGDAGERIPVLRQRLTITGDLAEYSAPDSILFDDSLEAAVKRFQNRHGLDIDGSVGKSTLAALNVPANQRVRQILLNLERWRWLPQDLGKRHILINIANYELDVNEDTVTVLTMRIIVGKTYRRTPVFSDKMTYLVLSPYWNIPANITSQDVIPMMKKNPEYIKEQNIKIFRGYGSERVEIRPESIDWAALSPKKFDFWLRQEPGPKNALGGIKFMFPNKFNVYLHDTPDKNLFSKSSRGFSSGCIRIEKPFDLALYLLRNLPNWSREEMIKAVNAGAERTVPLPEQIPVHVLYWTAWVSPDGGVNFREDIYNRDSVLSAALNEEHPEPLEN
ncbi:MAG: peptidoglycan-binding protein [candidate division Zixibacteria bacterium HGW-Zixibacteria-1]|nr:MAG: peptidoglycan-binding protein [candidate division Zixibacteria bacterium HGW-Zixibacteria-1]